MSDRAAKGEAAAAALLSILLLFIIAVTSVQAGCCSGTSWFRTEFEKYEVLGDTDMDLSMDEALRVAGVMMDYLCGERDDLEVRVDDGSTEREFFTGREKAHLKDVRTLFLRARALRTAAAAIAAAALVFVCLKARRSEGAARRAARAFIRASAAAVIVIAVIALAAAIDFDFWFTLMHRILFSNDLWLLDSDSSDLIDLLPLHFFMDTAGRSALITAAAYAAVNVPAAVIYRRLSVF